MSIWNVATPSALGVGLVVGGAAAAASMQPTFSERSTTQQLIVTGVSAAAGLGIGWLGARGVNKVAGRIPGGAVAALAGLAAGGLALQTLSNSGDGVPSRAVGAAGSLGTVAATIGAAGLAVIGARMLGGGAASLVPGTLSRTRGAVQALAGPLALAAGTGGLALMLRANDPTPAQPPSRVVEQAQLAAAAVADRPVSGAAPKLLDTVSGSGSSTLTLEELGKFGRRFVHEAIPGERIRDVMGEGIDPVRVYAGLDSGATPQARVDAAMRDLERLGAFDGSREKIVVATPTGKGFIDPPSIQAAEFMARGRIASVAIQYANKPSILATGSVPVGAETTELLVRAVNERIDRMPAGQRPEVALFGESLGAWAQQEVFEGDGTRALDELGVDRTLWVGAPHESSFPGEALAELGARANPGDLRQFDRIEEVDALDSAERAQLQHVLLTHRNDPVSVVNKSSLAYQRPDWLPARGERPYGIPEDMHYFPVVSFAQGMVDLVNGTRPVPGKFEAHAHDYRADLAEFVRVAYGHDRTGEPDAVNDAQVQRITEELVHLEKTRAATIRENPGW